MSKICVLNESELLHRHQLTADPGYYVVEEKDRQPPASGDGGYTPVPDILDGPFVCQSLADHVAESRYGMKREAS